MLAVKVEDERWIEIEHRSGDVVRIRLYEIQGGRRPTVHLAFDDAPRNFAIRRLPREYRRSRPPRPPRPDA